MSCPTWLRSIWCNSRCCVCWDPMNIDTMSKLFIYLHVYVIKILHALRYLWLPWSSSCLYLQEGVFMLDSGFNLLYALTSDRRATGDWCAVATRDNKLVQCSRTLVLVTLHTLLNAIICCFQLNTGWGADANRKVDYLGIDAVGLTVYVLCCNAQ